MGNFAVAEALGVGLFREAKLGVVGAFHAMLMRGIPEHRITITLRRGRLSSLTLHPWETAGRLMIAFS